LGNTAMSNKIYRAKDRLIITVLWAHAFILIPIAVLLRNFHDVWLVTGALGLAIFGFGWKAGTLVSRLIVATSLMIMSFQVIHMSGGLLEMHFHIFVALALLSIYYDWRPIVWAAVIVAGHHVVAWLLPGLYHVYPQPPDFKLVASHIGFVALASLVLSYQAIMINRSVNTLNQNSQTLIGHDLPQLLKYLQNVTRGQFGNEIDFKATKIPVFAHDELGNMSRLHNQLVSSLQTISSTTALLGQDLRAMLNRGYENIAHIQNIYTRMAHTVGNNNSMPMHNLITITKEPESLHGQIEQASVQMVLAAVRLDEMLHMVEARIAEQTRLCVQLENLNERKTKLFSTLSHELRTPLTGILGYGELLAISPALNEQDKFWAEQVTANALQMRQLINDILDLAKLDAGKIDFYPERTYVKDVFARLQDERAEQIAASPLQISFQTADDSVVMADTLRLQQILSYLLDNGFKFTAAGEIRLNAFRLNQPVKDSWQCPDGTGWEWKQPFPKPDLPTGEWVAVQVSDTGTGVPPEALPLLFEEFEKIDDRITLGSSGVDLELVLVKKLTELMGGQVFVESAAASGSTFTVLLPGWQAPIEIPNFARKTAARPPEANGVWVERLAV
jgi:signal transduction histidine kinase